MLRAVQLELDNTKATPFTLLFSLYNAKLVMKVSGWESLDLVKQCEYLDTYNINTKAARRNTVKNLIEKEQNFDDLLHKAYIRIHLKHVIAQYHRETFQLLRSTNIFEWTIHDIILSFIHHLIHTANNSDNKKTAHEKVWQFADYLRRYFNDQNYNGQAFLNAFKNTTSKNNTGTSKPVKGFGLQMMKTVCNTYKLKSGPYSKVKKQCNVWAHNIQNQSDGILQKGISADQKLPLDYQPQAKAVPIKSTVAVSKSQSGSSGSKFVTDVTVPFHQMQQIQTDPQDELTGKSWYWFSDNSGFKWIPYRDNDIQKLNMGWRNNEKSVAIMNGDYRVEFDRTNPKSPAGNQYNNRIQNPGGRTVICHAPKTEIHGIDVAKQPM